jgi:phosphatidylglycerophosphate synthase
MNFKSVFPFVLLYFRLVIVPFILVAALYQIPYYQAVICILIFLGLLSDIFDGLLARRWGISSPLFRRLDSTFDQIFWLSVIGSIYTCEPSFFHQNAFPVILVLILEGFIYLFSFLKFRKEVATHSIFSKIWTLTMAYFLIDLLFHSQAELSFWLCVGLGILSRLEILGILLLLKEWQNDIPSLYHAWLIRQGKKIEKNKLFND